MAVSQKQIAERLGVSITLVSRVLSGKARDVGIADATIARVMDAAREMGYVPSAAALTLKGKSTKTIGVVVYDFKDPFFGAIIENLQTQAFDFGYSLILSGFNKRLPEASNLSPLHKHSIDGLIILGSDEQADWLSDFSGLPVARIGHGNNAEPSVRIAIDETDAADQILTYLRDQGHRCLVYIHEHFMAHRVRLDALQKKADQLGLVLTHIQSERWAYEAGLTATRKILGEPEIDAIICATDKIAMGALHALHDAEQKRAVVGFDDIPAAAQFIPPITTMRQPVEEMTKLAFQAVFDGRTPVEISLKGSLSQRMSA